MCVCVCVCVCKNLEYYFPLRYYFPFAFSGMLELPLDFQGPIEKKRL